MDKLQNLDMMAKLASTGAQPLDPASGYESGYIWFPREFEPTTWFPGSFLSPHRNLLSTQIAATGAAMELHKSVMTWWRR